jgi:cytochrome oxidase assembly protein ShyY1
MPVDRPSTLWLLTRPSMLALHLLAVSAISGMVLAGWWQMDAYGSARNDAAAENASAPAVPLEQVMGPDDPFPDTALAAPVEVCGSYADAGQQFLVAGRENDGRDGFWVVTPLLVSADSAVLVVRGWQPTQSAPEAPSGRVCVTGVLQPGEQSATAVGADRVIDAVRIPTLVGAVPFDLYSGYVLRTAEDPPPHDGLIRVDLPAADVSWTEGLRNLAYALQWWLFAAFAAFMWWRICRDHVAHAAAAASTRAPARVG